MKIGSLFTGYGGLDMAIDGTVAWYSEIERAACQVLTAHHPDIPNLGDVTRIEWSTVPAVDILTAGYPCQPFSHLGKRQGENDERHLWPYVAVAIDALRPRVVILENVRGHLTLGFGDVLANLSRLGYDARWGVVRASDAGAPHQRARLFIVSYPSGTGFQGPRSGKSSATAREFGLVVTGSDDSVAYSSGERHGSRQRSASVGRLDQDNAGGARQRERSWQKPGTGSVEDVAHAESAEWGGTQPKHLATGHQGTTEFGERASTAWKQYEPAIRRWERILNRAAPEPTITSSNGKPRLSPVFVEWMMGLSEGWVTGHGLSNAQSLKMLGNGVVPQQAALALRLLTADKSWEG